MAQSNRKPVSQQAVEISEHSHFTAAELEEFRQQRIHAIQRNGAIRRVECPKCEALVGEDCHSKPKYYIGAFHAARKSLAGVS